MRLIQSVQARYIQPWMLQHFEKTKYGKHIASFKNRFAGKRCFIVANGPSLRSTDLELLYEHKEISFGMNRIYKIFGETHWRPTFFVCEDELIVQSQQKEIETVDAQEIFIPIELHWWHNISVKGACYFHLNYEENRRCRYSFSENVAHQVECRGTVTFSCMQIAAYMGFSEIYLLGVDHNYRVIVDTNGKIITDNDQKDYFCNDYDLDIKDVVVHDMGNNTKAYLDAKRYCDNTNRMVIYNATRGGKLEVFDRVNFDSLFK